MLGISYSSDFDVYLTRKSTEYTIDSVDAADTLDVDYTSSSDVETIISEAEISVENLADGLSLYGWTSTFTFSATSYRQVQWTGGTIKLSDGTTYSITSGNTGNMTELTYIFLDIDVSETVLQTTTTSTDSIGYNKILVGVAQNNSDTSVDASFQVFGGSGGVSVLVTADNIASNTITANEIASNTITSSEISVSQLSAISANCGTLTAGTIRGVLIQSTTGNNRIQLSTGDRLQFYYSGSIVGQMYSASNGDITLQGNDDVKFRAGGQDRCQVGSNAFKPLNSGYNLGENVNGERWDEIHCSTIFCNKVDLGNWVIEEDDDDADALEFRYNGNTRMKLETNGDLKIDGELTENN